MTDPNTLAIASPAESDAPLTGRAITRDTYTVFALTTDDDEFLVAGVIKGEHSCVDSEPASCGAFGSSFYRFATSVQAASPDQAEELAEIEYHDS